MQTQVLTNTYTLILCLFLTGSVFTFGCSEVGVNSSETSDKLWDDEGSWDDTNDSPAQVINSASNHAHDANAASTIPVPTQFGATCYL